MPREPDGARLEGVSNAALTRARYAPPGLYPLAIYAAAVAVIVLRERPLPRWLGIFAALTATALVVNGGFVFAGFVPALLLFLLWTLVTGVVLFRRTWAASTQAAYAT